jgi:3-oxoacyl-[acyl-carrier-protein] synthase II
MASTSSERRVVITGLGLVTPVGNTVDVFWKNLIAGQCGVDKITSWDPTPFDTQIAAQVKDFDPLPGLDLNKTNPDEAGAFIGSGIGGLQTTSEQLKVLFDRGPGRLSPFMIPMLISNMASGLVSMYFNLRGPNFATCSACATANHAIGEAWRTIKMGDAQVMFAGGAEATIVPIGIGGFCAMRAMSTRNNDPKRSSRPFDKERDGFVMGEGAGVVVLEELEHAKARGARIYAEMAGYGNTADAHHLTAPSPGGEGASRCMKMALRNAGLNTTDITYVNAHGTSTPQGDIAETQAIKTVFGDHASKLVVSSTKGATGHMLGAAGAVETIVCVKAIETDTVPPTINYEVPDPECDLDYVPNTARQMKVNAIVNNSFGFGGHNATITAKKFIG